MRHLILERKNMGGYFFGGLCILGSFTFYINIHVNYISKKVSWSYYKIYSLIVYIVFGFSMTLLGIAHFYNPLLSFANGLFAIMFLPFAFAPCGMKAFNVNPRLKLLKRVTFLIFGLLHIIVLML